MRIILISKNDNIGHNSNKQAACVVIVMICRKSKYDN